jgi:hypothetical protein
MFHAGAQIGFQSVKPYDAELRVHRSPTVRSTPTTNYCFPLTGKPASHRQARFAPLFNFPFNMETCFYVASLITTRQL